MSVKNVVSVGDDQEWKRAVEEVIRELQAEIDSLHRQLGQ